MTFEDMFNRFFSKGKPYKEVRSSKNIDERTNYIWNM